MRKIASATAAQQKEVCWESPPGNITIRTDGFPGTGITSWYQGCSTAVTGANSLEVIKTETLKGLPLKNDSTAQR
jgi:hypothetical protein